MKLRATGESDTFVFATSPINFGGVDREDLLFWMIPMAAYNSMFENSLHAFVVGCFCLWLYKKLTYGLPQGHLVLRVTVLFGDLEKGELATQYPALQKTLRTLNKLMMKVWLDRGLLPSPTYCNRYEP